MTLQEAIESVLGLQSRWSAENTPQMKQRGNLIKTIIPNLLGSIASQSGVRVEGSDGAGSRSRVPWVRIFDSKLSPSATKGWYVVFLFEASGKWVYLSLNQGTITWTGQKKKPINSVLLSRRAVQARKLVGNTNIASLLETIQLNDPGLGKNYETANVYALKYEAGNIPPDPHLSNDLQKLIGLLTRLYAPQSNNVNSGQDVNAAYLLAWNPGQWAWEDFAATVAKLQRDPSSAIKDTWTIGNQHVKPGDRLFLIRLGRAPKGIMGSGYSLSEPLQRPHRGTGDSKISHFVEVQWDSLLNPDNENILSLSQLQQKIPGMHWSTQKSGILIPPEYRSQLEELWQTLLKPRSTAVPYRPEDAISELFLEKETFQDLLELLKQRKNIVIQGPPGVGKTFLARKLAFALMAQKDPQRLEWVQFHQSYSYEDFIQGYRPNGNGFALRSGIFFRFCRRAATDRNRPYVFVIDEINRGNLGKIFGEVLSLLEEDKREVFSVELAYGSADPDRENSESFTIPKNVHVVGLMNTADRSLAVVDYALRRRFVFVSMVPRFEDPKFQALLSAHGVSTQMIRKIVANFTSLNARIRSDKRNLGAGFEIGHSFFCPKTAVTDENQWYRKIIEYEIKPLLQEYWFDDPDHALEETEALMSENSN